MMKLKKYELKKSQKKIKPGQISQTWVNFPNEVLDSDLIKKRISQPI